MTDVIIPNINSGSGLIGHEFWESYNRDLTAKDYDEIKTLCDEGELQRVVNEFNVRKFAYAPNDIMKYVVRTGSPTLTKWVFSKLCYDSGFYNISSLSKGDVNDQRIVEIIQRKRMKYGEDYEGEWRDWE